MCVAVWGFYTHSFTLHDTQLSCVFERKKNVKEAMIKTDDNKEIAKTR
jgi:hypothetical protein